MAVVKPFRALRYDERTAGPLDSLVAPPYDVISPEERLELRARSPYNVVHLTLPDSEEQAARDFAAWRRDGVLVPDDAEGFWALSQDYTGPDGVARRRAGLVASLRVEPYERRVVLPHERTHRGPKEGRLRLLRAVRAQLEPIFLLYDGPPVALPARPADLAAGGARLWRTDEAPDFSEVELLIADGHHRYETALAFHEQERTEASAFMPVVLVSTADSGLTIFPTHRIAGKIRLPLDSVATQDPLEALGALERAPRDGAAAVVYRSGGALTLEGEAGELDTELVERYVEGEVAYTPRAEEAIAAVDSGSAEAAFLLRPPRIEEVFAVARRGDVMPQKTTYFYPKLLSGLLFHPV